MTAAARVGFILMVGGGGCTTDVEQTLRHARQTAARDLIDQAMNIPELDPIVVVADEAAWLDTLAGLPVQLEQVDPDQSFHFGRTLTGLIRQYELTRCLYSGGGSAPLLSDAQLGQIVRAVCRDDPVLVTNNLHSTDWAAFFPADAYSSLEFWLERDNALAWIWQEKAGYPVQVAPRSAATQMDIDTPFDLLALARHSAVHPRLRAFLDRLDWPAAHLDAALDVLRREASHVIVAGRVSSWAWHLLERTTRCWVRVYAEERGMRASGRQARGEVRSLLNEFLDGVGVDHFFLRLAEMADAILLDSRVLLASRRLWPSDADRFYSDLLMDERVSDPFLRGLTAAARTSPVPVIMGGHSLVAGGLAVLLEGAKLAPMTQT